jgi:hypothetical protein
VNRTRAKCFIATKVVDWPLIQYVVDEAYDADIKHFVIFARHHRILFDRQIELENVLRGLLSLSFDGGNARRSRTNILRASASERR